MSGILICVCVVGKTTRHRALSATGCDIEFVDYLSFSKEFWLVFKENDDDDDAIIIINSVPVNFIAEEERSLKYSLFVQEMKGNNI